MNPAKIALNKRGVMVLMTFILIFLGIQSYQQLGRLAYPRFTIKQALVITPYPGATPQEVENEVTDVLEESIQSMGQLERVKSTSKEGVSIVEIEIKSKYNSAEIPQIWDELRRKINDVKGKLPVGVKPSEIVDDFGDVYGVFFAITGDGYSLDELKEYAKKLKKELLLVDDVAKIDIWGEQEEVIYVEFSRSRLSKLGISSQEIFNALNLQNMVEESGKVKVGHEYIRFIPSGNLTTEKAIENLYIRGNTGSLIQLKDVATVRRGYKDPAENLLHHNGQKAVGLGIATEKGGNVVKMGEVIKKRLKELEATQPLGMVLHVINLQSDNVTKSLNEFLINLLESVIIVIGMLLIFMGLRSGILIGGILLLSILGTFIGMKIMGINLQLISLGALVLALGMLVDNAIVVADGILIKVDCGLSREEAAIETVKETQWPLLGATLVAILAFMPVGFNPGNAGEFCRSLFYVLAISLSLSWILATTLTPLLCVWFLKPPTVEPGDPYDNVICRTYKRFLQWCLHHRKTTYTALILAMAIAIYSFGFVPKRFFSDSTRNQFFIDFWRSESTHINETTKDISKIERYVKSLDGVKSVTSFIGEGSLRFVLTYNYHSKNSSYGQLLVTVDDYREIKKMIPEINDYLKKNFPDAEPVIGIFSEGPPVEFTVEARFRGPDKKVLRRLAKQAKEILNKSGMALNIRDDWRQPVKNYRLLYSEAQAKRTGVTRSDLSNAMQWNFNGLRVGTYREDDDLIPIISRPPEKERKTVNNIEKIQVWSSALNCFLPLRQAVASIDMTWDAPLIQRRNRERTITVQCCQRSGMASTLRDRIKPEIEAIPLPPGYSMEWGGEYEESIKGQNGLKKLFPIALLLMFIIVACLFKTIREPIIIFLCLPFAITGVAAGLLIFNLPFGFMSILGFLGLTGMLIKNAIVLLDQINLELASGKQPRQAVIDSSLSRLRPVTMAAGTTIFGMIPLITHPFFSAMAATIMCGLLAATALTLIVVPVMYSSFFKIKPSN